MSRNLVDKAMQAIQRIISSGPCIQRKPDCEDLHIQYVLREYEQDFKDNWNLDIETDEGHFIGTEEELFKPHERAVRNAQRQSLLLEQRRSVLVGQRQSLFFPYSDDQQATAGASAPVSRTPSPVSVRRARPAPINIALVNTFGTLTSSSPTAAEHYVADTYCSEYLLSEYGQQHLEASWREVQMMSKAGNVARERRRRR